MKVKVANDNGYSAQKIMIDNVLYVQPNIYSMDKPKVVESKPIETYIPTLLDELYVTITSPSITSNGDYFVGKRAYNGGIIRQLRIDIDKHLQDTPIINTVSILAGVAIQKYYEKNKKVPKTITINADMVTALPINSNGEKESREFAERFMRDTHLVVVHLGTTSVSVSVKFDYVYVMPESATSIYSFVMDQYGNYRDDDIFKEIINEYALNGFTGEDIYNERSIAVADLGEGTFDFSHMQGYKQIIDISDSDEIGIGNILNKAVPQFKKELDFRSMTRQQFMEIYKDEEDSFHEEARSIFKVNSKDQVEQAIGFVDNMIVTVGRRQARLLLVHGGGSIVLKEELYAPFKEIMDKSRGKLLWASPEFAVTMNVYGMNVVLNTIYAEIKKKNLVVKGDAE